MWIVRQVFLEDDELTIQSKVDVWMGKKKLSKSKSMGKIIL